MKTENKITEKKNFRQGGERDGKSPRNKKSRKGGDEKTMGPTQAREEGREVIQGRRKEEKSGIGL